MRSGNWKDKEAVIKSAESFSKIIDWRKAFPGAYTSAWSNNWLTEATAHMTKRAQWTEENLLEDAKRFDSPSTWKAASPSAYATAGYLGIRDRCCDHMTRIRKPNGYWTKELCIASARRFQTLVEWSKEDGAALDAAYRRGWYKEAIEHMVEIVSFGEYCIRRYLMSHDIPFECEKTFEDLKVKRCMRYDFYVPSFDLLIEYHGEQHFLERENYHGRWTVEQIQEYDKLKEDYARDQAIPLLVVKEPNADEIEKCVDDRLRELTALRPGTPILGERRELTKQELQQLVTFGRWTYEKVIEDSLRYQNYSDWVGTGSYQVAHKRGWLKDASAHMTRGQFERGYWTPELLKVDALQYKSRKEWQIKSNSAYTAAYKQNIIDEVAPHMKPLRKSWNLESCKVSAGNYATRKEWQRAEGGAYNAALRNKWLDSCCGHMRWASTKPKK